jgi:ABC-type transporter Mla subunit MlaD
MEERPMAEERTTDSIRQAASEAMRSGEEVSRRMRDLTLDALKNRRFDREGIREVVRAVTEGMAAAAPSSGGSVRHAMSQAFRGMDEALTKSVQAGEEALRQLVATGRGITDNEVKQALAGLKKIEEDFVATVSQVADSANERARPELRELVKRATHAGTETSRQTAHLMAEFTFSGIELAGQFSVRFAQLASGVLAGMADALEKSAADRKKKP